MNIENCWGSVLQLYSYWSCTTKSPVLIVQLSRQILCVLKFYYKVASSQLPAPQIAPRTKVVLPSRQFSSSSSTDTPRTKVVLPSRQFSSSSSPDTPHTKVVLQSRQSHLPHLPAPQMLCVLKLHYKVASSQLPAPQIAPRTKVILASRQFSASSSTDCSAY